MPTVWSFGLCCCNNCVDNQTVDTWVNVNRVRDTVTGATGAIPPYPRRNSAPGPGCAEVGIGICPPVTGYLYCDLIPRWELPTEAACTGEHYQDWNCYHLTAVSGTNLSNIISGHKKVQAIKQWHGRKAFDGDSVCATGCPVESVRYRTVERTFRVVSGDWVWHDHNYDASGDPGDPIDYDWIWSSSGGVSRIFTVEKDSGIVTLDTCQDNFSGFAVKQPSPPFSDIPAYPMSPLQFNIPEYYYWTDTNVKALLYGAPLCDRITYEEGATHKTIMEGSASAASAYYFSGTLGDGTAVTFNETYTWHSYLTITPTEVTYTYDITGETVESVTSPGHYDREGTGTYSVEFKWKLTNEYPASGLLADVYSLLNEWDLQNHAQLPFRTDGYLAAAPIVGRHEYPVARSPDLLDVTCQLADSEGNGSYDWYDITTQRNIAGTVTDLYSGGVRGAPFASGWPDWSWDQDHETWLYCYDSDSRVYVPYIYTFGARNWTSVDNGDSTTSVIPPTSTWWQNNKLAGELRSHAWLAFDGYGLRAQKSAEVLVSSTPSFNYFRPCGLERFSIDSTTVHCVSSYFGGRSDPILFAGDITGEWSVGDLIVFLGNAPPPGDSFSNQIVPIVSTYFDGGSTQVIFGTALDVPAAYVQSADIEYFQDTTNATQYGSQGLAGKLRFQESIGGGVVKPWQRAICGSVNVTNATNASPIRVTVSADTWLVNGDQVTIAGVLGNTAANGDFHVLIADQKNFDLYTSPGVASTGNGTYAGGGTVTSKSGVGALSDILPDPVWNSSAHLGDYVEQVWPANSTTGGMAASATNTQRRLAGQCPILTITPNADYAATAQNIPFPTSLELTTCGAAWAARFMQQVNDPLWQTPYACEGGFGGCPDMVEARIDYPAGAPSGYPHAPFPLDPYPPASAGWTQGTGIMRVIEQITPWNPCEIILV